MHNYTQLRSDLIAQGFSKSEAYKIVYFIEGEDIVQEILHAQELKSIARELAANQEFWSWLARLQDKHNIDQFEALHKIAPAMEIERNQRLQLREKGWRESSVFLATVLKFFCELDDPHMLLVVATLEVASKPRDGVMDMSFG
jgi:hypothetical protein